MTDPISNGLLYWHVRLYTRGTRSADRLGLTIVIGQVERATFDSIQSASLQDTIREVVLFAMASVGHIRGCANYQYVGYVIFDQDWVSQLFRSCFLKQKYLSIFVSISANGIRRSWLKLFMINFFYHIHEAYWRGKTQFPGVPVRPQWYSFSGCTNCRSMVN
jgi:hypothetical protein